MDARAPKVQNQILTKLELFSFKHLCGYLWVSKEDWGTGLPPLYLLYAAQTDVQIPHVK